MKLLNLRKHSFNTSKGEFKPGVENGMEFEGAEAEGLLGYEGVIDAAKYAPAPADVQELEAENATLKAQLAGAVPEAAGAQIEALGSQIEELKGATTAAASRIEELEAENADLRKKIDEGIDPAAADRVKELEDENAKLRKTVDKLETKVEKLKS